MHRNTLDPSKAALLIVDVQEAFRNIVSDFARLATRMSVAARGFQILGRPVFVTEQYPKGLGRTAAEIIEVLPADFAYIEKTAFSSCGAGQLVDGFKQAAARQIVVGGLEAHVCVNQTALDLLDLGYDVHILSDCIAARSNGDRKAGISKMLASGAVSSSVEMALFELMRDARHEQFKAIQALIR